MNKSNVTNLIALLITIVGFSKPFENNIILMIGLFSLSGGITNWLAIHMLFEKIPFIYGSGIIPKNFIFFKAAIKELILEEFFTPQNIENFTRNFRTESIKIIKTNINYNNIFEGLTVSIEKSQLGRMLSMVGGRKALEPLRKPIINKLESLVSNMLETQKETKLDKNVISKLHNEIGHLVDSRLNELSPNEIKKMIKDIIDNHLGWLVIWGGVFGGFIGLITSLINLL
jgi:uncharacterized membrane protein YheB (UPF0754 family)